MSLRERSRDSHQVTRNNGRQDALLAAFQARGHSRLKANWLVRVRGDRRPPVRPLGQQAPAPSLDGGQEIADVVTSGSANGTAPRQETHGESRSRKDTEAGVLMFPEIVLPPPEKPVRGPLSWAYWSARRK